MDYSLELRPFDRFQISMPQNIELPNAADLRIAGKALDLKPIVCPDGSAFAQVRMFGAQFLVGFRHCPVAPRAGEGL
jgi:hypothetical protein